MSIQRGLKIECPYEGCGSEFPTDRSLRVHIRGHQASSPFGCEYAGCTAVFATVSERSTHKATVHAEKRNQGKVVVESNGVKKRDKSSDSRTGVGDSVFADSIISNESHSAPDSNVVDDLFESDDIREIADNSAYFVSQVRNIQRRDNTVQMWNEADIQNLYQWAVWVQETVSKLNDEDWGKLDIALQKRRTKITGLKDSEKAMMYALLSDTNLKSDTVKHILKSVAETEHNHDKYEIVMEVMKQCAWQKVDLNLYIQCRNILLQLCDQDVVEESCAVLSGIEAQAKGLLLARRVENGISSLRLDTPDSTERSDAWGQILLWTAFFMNSDVEGDDGEDKDVLKKRKENKSELWRLVRHYVGMEVIWDIPANAMHVLCEKDVCVFDCYLSYLLITLREGGAPAAECAKRVRGLAKSNGRSGWMTREVAIAFSHATGIIGLI